MIREISQKTIKYREYWVARVIQDCGSKKVVYSEHFFENMPTQQEIVDILTRVPKDCFISVVHNYQLVDDSDVPF